MSRFLVALSIIAKAGLLVDSWIISDRVLHPPRKAEDHTLDDFNLPARDVTFLSRDGTKLAGWYVPAAVVPAPGIVLSHRHGLSRSALPPQAHFLHQQGDAVLALDYRRRRASRLCRRPRTGGRRSRGG